MGDVARLAGVSHQTVSRVVNESTNVSPETRTRVLDAMRTLDYRPNPAAKSLVTGRSRTLGVVSFDTALFGPASTLAGIERAARAERYAVSVASLKSIDRNAVLDAVERLRDQRVAGIAVVAPTVATFKALQVVPSHTPLVAVEGDPHLDFRWWPSTRYAAPARPRSTWSTSATGRSGTSADRGPGSRPTAASGGGATR